MIELLAVIPTPDPLPLPAPPWLMWLLLMLTFFLHVLAMNFVLGGSLITLAARANGGADGKLLAKRFGKAMPISVAAAVTLGVAPLLFLQVLYGRLFFSSSVLMAWFWFSVVPLLIVAYYGTYVLALRGDKLGGWAFGVSAAVAVIFAFIGFVYSNNMTLMLRPDRFLPMFVNDARGVQLNLSDPTLVPRYLHMLLGAVAVAGLVVAVYGVFASRTDEGHGKWAMRQGALWFGWATLFNVVVGTWWGFSLPREVIRRFMGESISATAWLAIGSIAGFVALVLMATAVKADDPKPLIRNSAILTVITLLAMIVSRDHVRRGMLEIAQFTPATWIEPQWSIIAIFGVLLVAALATVAWMAMLLRPARR